MSVRRTILIEKYHWPYLSVQAAGCDYWWCAREYVQHDDESRTTRVLHTAPTLPVASGDCGRVRARVVGA